MVENGTMENNLEILPSNIGMLPIKNRSKQLHLLGYYLCLYTRGIKSGSAGTK